MRAAVRRRETPALAQEAPAPLKGVATRDEALDARVCRDDRRDLVAYLGCGREAKRHRTFRTYAPADLREDRPLGARLARTRAGDLGAQDDAPLGRGLGAAAGLLVPGHRGEQEHLVAVDEHLSRKHDVLMHAQRCARERAT